MLTDREIVERNYYQERRGNAVALARWAYNRAVEDCAKVLDGHNVSLETRHYADSANICRSLKHQEES